MPTDPFGIIALVLVIVAAMINCYCAVNAYDRYARAQNHATYGNASSLALRRERLHRQYMRRYLVGILITTIIGALPILTFLR